MIIPYKKAKERGFDGNWNVSRGFYGKMVGKYTKIMLSETSFLMIP
jgi:hypothetical protein